MIGQLETKKRTLFTRQCVACGYDGALLRGGRAERCARCGCDLKQRPARSYAEMEGLLKPPAPRVIAPPQLTRNTRIMKRWILFMSATMVGMIAFFYLVASAFTT